MAIKKQNILVKILVDSREKDNTWIKYFKFDKRYSTEKIKIEGYEIVEPFKCLDFNGDKIKTSTGDIGIIYSLDEGVTWNETNLSIELKKDEDFTSTLYSSYKRFSGELDRVKNYGLDFFIVYNQSTRDMHSHFDKLKHMKRINYYSNPEKVVYDRMIDISRSGVPLIYTHEIHEVIKRIIKSHIKYKNLQKTS